jgi:hypothetical protein
MSSYLEEMLDSALSQREKMDFPLILVVENGSNKMSELLGNLFASHYESFYTFTDGGDMDVALQMTAIPEHVEVAIIGLTTSDAVSIRNTCQILRPSHGICLLEESTHLDLLQALKQIKGLMFVDNEHQAVVDESAMYAKKILFAQSDDLDKNHKPYEIHFHDHEVSFLNDKGEKQTTQNNIKSPNLVKAMVALGRYFKIPTEKIILAIQND